MESNCTFTIFILWNFCLFSRFFSLKFCGPWWSDSPHRVQWGHAERRPSKRVWGSTARWNICDRDSLCTPPYPLHRAGQLCRKVRPKRYLNLTHSSIYKHTIRCHNGLRIHWNANRSCNKYTRIFLNMPYDSRCTLTWRETLENDEAGCDTTSESGSTLSGKLTLQKNHAF